MHFAWRLLIAEVIGFTALLLVALVLAAYGAWDSHVHGTSELFGNAGKFLFVVTLAFGALPVALVGAPGYLLLHVRGLARWYWVLLLGVAPSLLFLVFAPDLVWWAAGCGAAVALITHLLASRLRGRWSIAATDARGAFASMHGMAKTFRDRWAERERELGLGPYPARMIEIGTDVLPDSAAPCLDFSEAAIPKPIHEVFGAPHDWSAGDRERLQPYLVIGSDGAGNPICIEQGSGHVLLLDHEDSFRTLTFVNSSIHQLAECLFAYLGEDSPARFNASVQFSVKIKCSGFSP